MNKTVLELPKTNNVKNTTDKITRKRCSKGTRKNKKTGECEPILSNAHISSHISSPISSATLSPISLPISSPLNAKKMNRCSKVTRKN
jgi:hypothetical protein